MTPDSQSRAVQLIRFEETSVAVLEHRGNPNLIGDSVRRFIEWRKQNHLSPKISATFNILYGHPSETPPENYRLDICASTEQEVAENSYGVSQKVIPGGRIFLPLQEVDYSTRLLQQQFSSCNAVDARRGVGSGQLG